MQRANVYFGMKKRPAKKKKVLDNLPYSCYNEGILQKARSIMKIQADFNSVIGKIKPMHAVGQPPLDHIQTSLFHYLTDAGMPQSRLHDAAGAYGRNQFVDIPNIFRNFDADENDPASYSFGFTDIMIKALIDADVEPYFRLGVTIENFRLIERLTTYPPADFEKWARICEHIIRHYNEGWADGFHYGIRYWEIWNEADDCLDPNISSMWAAPMEEYFRLYDVTAKHLKACFGDSIKVGGYAATGVNAYAQDEKLEGLDRPAKDDEEHRIEFIHGFFRYIKAHGSPIDFFSYHTYNPVATSVEHVRYYDRLLAKYGYSHVERHLNEWNLCWAFPGVDPNDKENPVFAPSTLAMMLAMQNEAVDILHYYDARLGTSCCGGLFNAATRQPNNTYWGFHMFNALYKLGDQVACSSDDNAVYALAARNDKRASLVIANTAGETKEIELSLVGVADKEIEVMRIDNVYRYTLTGERIKNSKLTVPAYGCVELRFF